MTDPTDPTDNNPDDARSERAFRDALAARADTLEPTPLSAGSRRRSWAWWAAGAAAVTMVAATATFAVVTAQEDVGGPDPAVATAPETSAPAPVAEASTRLIVYRSLQLAVPADWATRPTPNDNGCEYPRQPFVATYDPTQVFTLQLCVSSEKPRPPVGFPTVESTSWTPSVQISPVSAAGESLPDGTETFKGWTLTRKTFGDLRVEILTDAATADVVEPILASATTVDEDALGCSTTSPAQSVQFARPDAFDVTGVTSVSSIVVCQYSRVEGQAGLVASTELTGDDAQTELEAIQAAPEGGGPDHPERCAPDLYGDSALVLQLRDDAGASLGDLFVYYDWCFGNGIDDGTTPRTLTRANCAPLFTGAVTQMSGDSSTFELCHPDR